MTLRRLLLIAVALLACGSGGDAAWNGSKAFQSCIAAADGNDPTMADCTRTEFDREDARLNAAYRARMTAADGRLKEAIRSSQRAWLSYRDLTCDAEGARYEGGTMEPLASLNCKVRLTSERAAWLKDLEP